MSQPSLRPVRPAAPRPAAPRRLAALGLAALLLPAACADKADQQAKARIFSPEEPAADVQRASETVRVEEAATDPAVWRRLWLMDRSEVTRRIGAHRAQATVKFKWTRAGRQLALAEEQTFETDREGQFHASVLNDQDSGLEFVWAGGKAYAKSRYGPYRARRIDRAQHDAWRDKATSALSTSFGLFDRTLRAAPLGQVEVEGHSALKYGLVLGEPWGPEQARPQLPPVVYGQVKAAAQKEGAQKEGLQPGPDEDTRRRLEMEQRLTPQKVQGEVLVDRQTAVILQAALKGRFVVPAQKEGEAPAELELEVKYALTPDAKVAVAAPAEVAAPRMPHVVNDPLWFLGADGPKAAGSAAPAKEEDEAGEDAPDEEPQQAAPAKKPARKP